MASKAPKSQKSIAPEVSAPVSANASAKAKIVKSAAPVASAPVPSVERGIESEKSLEAATEKKSKSTGSSIGKVVSAVEGFVSGVAGRQLEPDAPFITDFDLYLLQEGKHLRTYEKLGAHVIERGGKKGVHFAVWAPNARRVSVVGHFNHWNGDANVMEPLHSSGLWTTFIPDLAEGALYKYELQDAHGHLLPLKADPYAFFAELPTATATASIVAALPKAKDTQRGRQSRRDAISIYEVHLGSWRRKDGNQPLTYTDLIDTLIPYAQWMGFTHLELMPVHEHPFNGSWGYQPTGLFAPTSRYGTPEEFAAFVEAAHAAGLSIIIDWVPGHFPSDAFGMAQFDGTHLYDHSDPREGFHQDWNTLIYNYGRTEVANFLIANALFWIDRYGIDALRVDAVASMLYRDYSRKDGEWVPNKFGGRENLEAIDFLRRMNEAVFAHFPNATTMAEESTAFPGVSRPTYDGGLGFGFKWNMGWMHDTLAYMQKDPIYRRYEHNHLTFGMVYAYSENFVLPLSHDEVVHGKGSLINKMPGDHWQKFANLRSYYGFMWGHPGKKLLFMGCEFAQWREWNHDASLDWHLAEEATHRGIQLLVRDLNRAYRDLPALHARDCEPEGFEWLLSDSAEDSVVAFLRKGAGEHELAVVVSNFTPVPRIGYCIGVPRQGFYEERLNTDSAYYGGSGMGNGGGAWSVHAPCSGRDHSLFLTLPPLSTIILTFRGD